MAAAATETGKRWGRIGAVAEVLGVDQRTVPQVIAASRIPVRDLPGVSHRLYDLDAVRRVAETSTRPGGAGATRAGS